MWRFLGNTELAIWLLFAICLALTVGSRYAKRDPGFGELDFLRFQDWLAVGGTSATWWLWVLFALLALFGLNTAVCTTDRLAFLLRRRKEYRSRAFLVTIAPSIMHLLFLVVISGHAWSTFGATVRRMPAEAGAQLALSQAVVEVQGSECVRRVEPGLTDHIQGCAASLSLSSAGKLETRRIEFLRPIRWEGYSIHLKPRDMPRRGELPVLQLVVKKDPGFDLIIAGNAALCLLMVWYFPIIIRRRSEERS